MKEQQRRARARTKLKPKPKELGLKVVPRRRQPKEIWYGVTRPAVWGRDNKRCVRCKILLSLYEAHIDHIVSGRYGSNAKSNLRTLCRRCHVLRADLRHRGMIADALRDGIIPPNWRELVWETL